VSVCVLLRRYVYYCQTKMIFFWSEGGEPSVNPQIDRQVTAHNYI